MKKLCFLFVCSVLLNSDAFTQDKGKPVKYSAVGGHVYPVGDNMIGVNHVTYRKLGIGISTRLGINNYLMNREGYSKITLENARSNGWLTGKSKSAYGFSIGLNLVVPVTKKIPFYIGAGMIRHREALEIAAPFFAPGKTEFALDPERLRFKPTFTAGIYVPLFSRIVLNVAYDTRPNLLFVGLAISDPFNYIEFLYI